MPCSIASRCSTSPAISRGSSPNVCRFTRRASSAEPTTPSTVAIARISSPSAGRLHDALDERRRVLARRHDPDHHAVVAHHRHVRDQRVVDAVSTTPTHDRPAAIMLSPSGSGSPTCAGSGEVSTVPVRVGDDHERRRRTGCARSPRTSAAGGSARIRERACARRGSPPRPRRPTASAGPRCPGSSSSPGTPENTATAASSVATISSCQPSSCRDREPRSAMGSSSPSPRPAAREHNDHNDHCARNATMPRRPGAPCQTRGCRAERLRCKRNR